MAEKIHLRIDQLNAANSIEELIQFKIGRCHPLSGDKNGEFAMDLVHPFRLVFKREIYVEDIILIISIENYH